MKLFVRTLIAATVLSLGVAGWLFFGKRDVHSTESKPTPRGAEFSAAFDGQLNRIGQISMEEFNKRYGTTAKYLDGIRWDPTKAKFWDKFSINPNAKGAKVRVYGRQAQAIRNFQQAKTGKRIDPKEPVYASLKGRPDFRLNEAELELFKKNGFVVSGRRGAKNFVELYYRIYERDLPVFITADSVLHAWHRSYDLMLEHLEAHYLHQSLVTILFGMAEKIPQAQKDYGNGLHADSLRDADLFLTVACSLLVDASQKSQLDQDAKVRRMLDAAAAMRMETLEIFGRSRTMDFSQFKVRGHYEKSDQLKRFFRAMMWCGRIDLRIAGNPSESSPRELGAAIVLSDLLRRSGHFDKWRKMDELLQVFVGRTDSMTFAHMNGVLAKAGIQSPAQVADVESLAALQKKIESSEFGLQQICGHVYVAGGGSQPVELPRSFTVLGQKFVVEGWVTSKVTYDDIFWNSRPVRRMLPTCLDVAFAVLRNNQIVPELTRANAAGHNYQHNLAATREVIDELKPQTWEDNLYTGWLGSLRELSKPTTDAKYPQAMRTRAWAMKTANTQLASWSQLRHDTILYAKQSYSKVSCFYPAGYVEPIPHFWLKMEQMASRAAALIDGIPLAKQNNAVWLKKRQVAFLKHFAGTMKTLRAISENELAQKSLSKIETKFLKDTVEIDRGCGGPPSYSGWYPRLYYGGSDDALNWDALVADVHTDPMSGRILHQGVGNVDLLTIAIDNGDDRMVFAGPVLSHYEFTQDRLQRLSDSQWRGRISAGNLPPRPEWTRGYLVTK